jgi:glycosyltransferase involved in cell wall biosynthesis
MDILIVGGSPGHRGGVEQFCDRALEALTAIGGHRVVLVNTNAAYLRLRSIPSLVTCLRDLVQHRRLGFRQLWLQYVCLPELAILVAARLLGFTILVTPHLGSNWSSQARPSLRWLTRKLLALSDAIGLISPTQAEEISLPSSPLRVALVTFLPRHFPPRPPTPATASDRLRLVHAGRLSEGKGTFLFLELCAILHRANRDFEAQLIGSCDRADEMRIDDFIAQHDLREVTKVGRVLEPEMLERLSSADVLIHLSRIDSFPLIVLESIGCGVYPICKDLHGARLMVETYCGRIVGGDDPVRDTAAILLADPSASFRAAAEPARKRLLTDFDWRRCVSAVEQAFETLAAR